MSAFSSRDRYAWCLALTPLCGYLLARINYLLNFLNGVGVPILINTLVCLAVLAFWAFDIQCLYRHGYKTGIWRFSALLLIPAYLFIRAYKTKGHYFYAITCVLSYLVYLL